jgi:hypothetical protein
MNPILTKNFVAEAVIPAFRIVKQGAVDGQVLSGAAATDFIFGVTGTLGADAANDRIDVTVVGIAEIEAGGVINRGDPVTTDALGMAIAATRHTHVENTAAAYVQNATTAVASAERIIGFAMVDAIAGDVADVLLAPGLA